MLAGSDLGVAGSVTFGSVAVEASSYGADGVAFVVPAAAEGSVAVTVDCGKSSKRSPLWSLPRQPTRSA